MLISVTGNPLKVSISMRVELRRKLREIVYRESSISAAKEAEEGSESKVDLTRQ